MTTASGDYRDPSRREHFVYRVYDCRDRVLYVGCTMRPERRLREHRTNGATWLNAAARVRMTGPMTYAAARALERQEQEELEPLHGMTPRRWAFVNSRQNLSGRRAPYVAGSAS